MNIVKAKIKPVMIATLTVTLLLAMGGCGKPVAVVGPTNGDVFVVPRGRVIYLSGQTWTAALLITKQEPAHGKLGRDSAEYEWLYNEGPNILEDATNAVSGTGMTTGDHPWITVGPIRLKWSYRTADSGWIYTDIDSPIDVSVSERESLKNGGIAKIENSHSPGAEEQDQRR